MKVEQCDKYRRQTPESLLPSPTADGSWQKQGADLFHLNNSTYLTVFDYFSGFMEMAKMTSTKSSIMVASMRSWFTRSRIPLLLISENAPQFASENFNIFADTWGFTHSTSSLLFPQCNGAAKREVQTAKQLLCKSSDLPDALSVQINPPL